MKRLNLGLLICFMLFITTYGQAQSPNQLSLKYDWMKDQTKSLDLNSTDTYDFFSKDHTLVVRTDQKEKNFPLGEANRNRYTLLIAVPDTDKIVEMPTMKIDTSMHYHLRWKQIE